MQTANQTVTQETTPDERAYTAYMGALREEIATNYQSGYSQMPDQVRQDRTVSPKAKIVYEQLLSYMWFKTERCFPSQQTIADATGYSRRSVIRALAELYERGYIEKWRRGQGYTNYYFINPLVFPHSFKRSAPADAATMVLPTSSPELRQDVTTAKPRSIDAVLTMCHPDTSRSDKNTQPEAPESHTKQTKANGNTQDDKRSSNISTTEKGMHIAAATIRSEQGGNQPNGEGTNNQPSTAMLSKSKTKPNEQEKDSPSRAEAVETAINEKTDQERRPIPNFITEIMTRYSQELGDTARSTRSNITRAAKIYYFASDFIKDAQDDPQHFFLDLLYDAKQAAYKVNCIRHRSNGNTPNRIPVFFTCLENFFELSPDERAYIRSDAPLIPKKEPSR